MVVLRHDRCRGDGGGAGLANGHEVNPRPDRRGELDEMGDELVDAEPAIVGGQSRALRQSTT